MIKTIGVSMFTQCLITGVITEYTTKKNFGGGGQSLLSSKRSPDCPIALFSYNMRLDEYFAI